MENQTQPEPQEQALAPAALPAAQADGELARSAQLAAEEAELILDENDVPEDSDIVSAMEQTGVNSRGFVNPIYTRKGRRKQLQALQPRHMMVMDLLLSNPTITSKEIAKRTGMSEGWVTTTVNSDIFQGVLQDRRNCIQRMQGEEIKHRMVGLLGKSISAMEDALDDEEVPIRTKMEIGKLAMQGLGMGGNSRGQAEAQPTVQVNNYTVAESSLAAARERILSRSTTGGTALPSSGPSVTIDALPS